MEDEESFAKTVVKSVAGFVAFLALVLGMLTAFPTDADAATYTPPVTPVEVIPDLEADWLSKIPTMTPEELALERARMQTGGMTAAQKAGFGVNGALSKMSPLARGNTVLLAGSAGFAVGAGGMRLVYAATGQDWDQTMCTLPPLVRDGYALLSFGAGSSSCPQPVLTPNGDQGETFSDIIVGSSSVKYTGSVARPGYTGYCYVSTGGGIPYLQLYLRNGDGTWSNPLRGGPYAGCSDVEGRLYAYGPLTPDGPENLNRPGSPAVQYRSPSGEVLGEMVASRADPTRKYRVGAHMPGGGSGYSPRCAVVESKDSEGFPLGKLGASCEGVAIDPANPPDSLAVEEYNPSTGAWTPVLESPLPLEQRQAMQAYPECYDGSQQCTLTLQAARGTVKSECLTSGTCAGWWTDTVQGTQPLTADGRQFECSYGPYPVALERCSVYRQAFETGTKAGTITDPGGHPLPKGEGSTSPNTINPGVKVPGAGDNCMDTWGDDFNPIDWVLTPVKCALMWAFVPRTEVVMQVQSQVENAWSDTAVAQVVPVVLDVMTVPGVSGCQGPHVVWQVQWPTTFGMDAYPLSACEPPASILAGFAQLLSGVLLVGWTVFGVSRRLSAIVSAPGVGPA